LIIRDWGKAARKTGIKINPHLLRKWFATEMARLKIQTGMLMLSRETPNNLG